MTHSYKIPAFVLFALLLASCGPSGNTSIQETGDASTAATDSEGFSDDSSAGPAL